MPIKRKAEEAGVFDPSEVALLGRVFDRLKIEGQSEQRREALASLIIANYMAGVVDEEELVSASKLTGGGPRARRSRGAVGLFAWLDGTQPGEES
ncbi:hypothetical protein AJ88_34715 [Mesorhizobium amorphae CCBAU 01583]|nr:hypothetical protein AJ88_34715 [Mesorhizobium amorphae CCBAU 01583]